MEYGLIGAKLGHSYSKIIHEAVCGYSYELHPLPTEEEAHAFMQAKAFKAINVTIPYKKLVIPYCDEVEPRAAAIGAVNTVVNRDGKLYGYNTDYTGFAYLARCIFLPGHSWCWGCSTCFRCYRWMAGVCCGTLQHG